MCGVCTRVCAVCACVYVIRALYVCVHLTQLRNVLAITLTWGEVPFVPKRSLVHLMVSSGTVVSRHVYLLPMLLTVGLTPGTSPCMSRLSQCTGKGIWGGRMV